MTFYSSTFAMNVSLDFSPVLSEILPNVKNISFSIMYFGKHCGKYVLITKHQTKTIMIALRDHPDWSIEFHTTISSRGKSIKTSHRIEGNQNLILLLDGDGNLWKLINAFEFSNEKDECLYLIDEKCFYEWVPFKKLHNSQVLDFTGLTNGFAFMLLKNNENKVLQVYTANNLQDYTFEELNLTTSKSYQLTCVKLGETDCVEKKSEIINEALIVTDKPSGTTYIYTKNRCVSLLNVSNLQLVSILVIELKKCLLLCYETGKILFVCVNEDFSIVKECSAYLFDNVACIQLCTCCKSCLIWSDGGNIHHTSIKFNFDDQLCFVDLVELEVTRNIMGVKSLITIHNGLLAVTINHFYYHIFSNSIKPARERIESTDEILSKIFDCGLKMNTIKNEIENNTDYLKFQEIIRTESYENLFEIKRENEFLVIKTNMNEILRKNQWRVRQEACLNNKYFVEMTELETDLYQGMMLKFKSSLMSMNQVELTLVGDFGNDLDLLCMFLGKIDVDQNTDAEEIRRNLEEIAKRRNPYFKNK